MHSAATQRTFPDFPGFIVVRDRLASLISDHATALRSLLCGLALMWVALSACAFPTPLSKWALLLGPAILGLSFLRLRLAAALVGIVCTVQMLSVHGQLGFVTAFLSLILVAACGRHSGRVCAVLAAPYLLRSGLGIAVPLGLAAGSPRPVAAVWGGVSFLWCALHAFAAGQPRLGIAAIPRFGTVFAKPPATPIRFDGSWVSFAVGEIEIEPLLDDFLAFLVQPATCIPFIFQFALWCGAAALLRGLFQRHRIKDRLALAYLERVTRKAEPSPQQRPLLLAVAAGAGAFVLGYAFLGLLSGDVRYGVLAVLLDLVAAAILFVPAAAMLEGDANAGRKAKSPQPTDLEAALDALPQAGESLVRPRYQRPAAPRTPAPAPPASPPASPGAPKPAAAATPAEENLPPWLRSGGAGRFASAAAAGAAGKQIWTAPRSAAPAARTRITDSGTATFAVEAIAFIDMVGSTAMGSKYGDEYVLTLKEHLGEIVREESDRHNVLFCKGTGDGYMLSFPEAADAASAMCGVMRGVLVLNGDIPEPRALHLRIGIHLGQVNIDSRGDRIGTAANFAARIEAATIEQLASTEDPDQVELPDRDRILVSEVIHGELKGVTGFRMRPIGYFEFKGITGLHRIFELEVI